MKFKVRSVDLDIFVNYHHFYVNAIMSTQANEYDCKFIKKHFFQYLGALDVFAALDVVLQVFLRKSPDG
jgi:hypothetical protein